MEPREKPVKAWLNKFKISKSILLRRVSIIEDWYVFPKVGKRKKLFTMHTQYGSYLKINSTYKDILKSGFKWENIQVDIRDFLL